MTTRRRDDLDLNASEAGAAEDALSRPLEAQRVQPATCRRWRWRLDRPPPLSRLDRSSEVLYLSLIQDNDSAASSLSSGSSLTRTRSMREMVPLTAK